MAFFEQLTKSSSKMVKDAPNATLVASSSRSLSKAQVFAKKHKAAKAGKHILCEKPLPTGSALKRILSAYRENNVAYMS